MKWINELFGRVKLRDGQALPPGKYDVKIEGVTHIHFHASGQQKLLVDITIIDKKEDKQL